MSRLIDLTATEVGLVEGGDDDGCGTPVMMPPSVTIAFTLFPPKL